MKLKWYYNRLRSMGADEILYRVGDHWRKTLSRRYGHGWTLYAAETIHPVFTSLSHRLMHAEPAEQDAIRQSAESALTGNFSALGVNWPARSGQSLFPADLWRLDPVTGSLWPGAETYTFDIDYRHDRARGDVKYVWEIARLQQLPVLAAHAVLTGDARAVAAVETAVASWHEANPPFCGVGWASGIEVALRSISLLVTHDLLRERLGTVCRDQIGQILAASFYWLARFPSRFSSANNHLIAELAGEYLLGLALGRATEDARTRLSAEALKQILPDGIPAEQSPTYGAFTAEFVLLCMTAARDNGQTFGSAVEERLSVFADFIEWLPQGIGFGDDDEGRVVTLGDEQYYAHSVAGAIRGFLGATGGVSDFRAVLTSGQAGIIRRREGLQIFREGGLTVWRGKLGGRSADITFDHGPLGYLSIAAHGHADALGLTLRLDDEPVLVDPGTWAYSSGGVWRNWFRSTPAHNTLNIRGQDQSIMSGPFNWAHKAVSTLIESNDTLHWSVTAKHNGYERRFGVIHERRVERRNEAVVVTDRLDGGREEAELVFQIAPGLDVEISNNTARVTKNGQAFLEIRFPSAAIEVCRGGTMPGKAGWVSTRFGLKTPASRIAWRGMIGDQGVETALQPISRS